MLVNQFAIYPAGAVISRVPGLHIGDWATYVVAFNYTTNDPSPPVSPPPTGFEDLEYYKIEVQSVIGTNITFTTTLRFKNGTEQTTVMRVDVAGYSMGIPAFIAANLSAGDQVYPVPYSPVINATLVRWDAGAERGVNFVGAKTNASYPKPDYWYAAESDYYWDRASGIIADMMMEGQYIHREEGYVTMVYARIAMRETNIWEEGVEAISADVSLLPQVLNLESRGEWVFAIVKLPEGYKSQDVDVSSIILNETIAPESLWKLGKRWLLLRFDREKIISLIKSQTLTKQHLFLTRCFAYNRWQTEMEPLSKELMESESSVRTYTKCKQE